jgi:hypothetical protein
MFQLLRELSIQQLITRQLPTFLAAFLVAEMLYKFHSFTLECLAFLVTWYVFDALAELPILVVRSLRGRKPSGGMKEH